MEISNLSQNLKYFIRMLNALRKKPWNGKKSGLDEVEDWISNLVDKVVENTEIEQQK